MTATTRTCFILLALFGTLQAQMTTAAATTGTATTAAATTAAATTGTATTAAATTAAATTAASSTGAASTAAASTAAPAASTASAATTAAPAATTTTAASTRPPWPKPNCGNPALTNAMRALFLNMHNNFRGSLARGQTETSAGWGIAPPAALMYRMKYNCNAESYAQQAVNTCRRTELPAYALGGYKQNLFILNTVQTTPEGAIQYAVSQWWSQLARFGMRSNMIFYQSEFNRGARNVLKWAKMAWWNNRQVGCSVRNCGTFYAVSCMYTPGGLNVNTPVYRIGAVCSGCGGGQCDGQALCRW